MSKPLASAFAPTGASATVPRHHRARAVHIADKAYRAIALLGRDLSLVSMITSIRRRGSPNRQEEVA
jgi:hypothetical protein